MDECVAAWAASGAMALTGRATGPPLGPPAPLVPRLRDVGDVIRRRSRELGHEVDLDPLALLGERAAILGLDRNGAVSCGGSTHLLRAADGWVAVALARPDDVALVPAWLELDEPLPDDPAGRWERLATELAHHPSASVTERARLLGLPVSALPASPPPAPSPYRAVALGDDRPALTSLADVVVVDLSSLWAGPLCASVLAAVGAQVIKVESTGRPDGARQGPAPFFDLLNGGKQSVALDFASTDGRTALRRLLAQADVVIEASRPRALEQLGMVAGDSTRVWVSITGYGREPPGCDRVAFGDDAAVGGGLVVFDDDGPCFCADAVADPASGLVAAAACLDALATGGRWLLDVPMAQVAAHLAGPTLDGASAPAVAPPRARPLDR